MNHEISFYEKKDDCIRCNICPHNCILKEGKFGVCKVRTVDDNVGVVINYGEVTSANVDPIEKKPLYHYKPSKDILSVGSFGCNMSCSFCQNYEISQYKAKSEYIDIEKLISFIADIDGNIGVAFTYNEPLMWYEYVYDAAKRIKEYDKDISVVLVSNGYINEEALLKLLPYIDAMNIDLKGFTNKYYNNICGAKLEPVLDTIKIANEYCHVEITTLMVNEENDSIEEISQVAEFIASIDKNIPLHLSRYFPRYKMNNPATHVDDIMDARNEAKKYLNYVYVGNIAGIDNNTYCPNCKYELISRDIYDTKVMISGDKCPICSEYINMTL